MYLAEQGILSQSGIHNLALTGEIARAAGQATYAMGGNAVKARGAKGKRARVGVL